MIKQTDLLDGAPDNLTIMDALGKCLQQVRNHEKITVSVSGGWDSDIMADILLRCGCKEKTIFVFFNTGLEYKATKRHIQYLNEKYGIEIIIVPPVKPIPTCAKQYGIPFWSKRVSEYMERLQRHGFQWEDEPLDVLLKKYPKCKAALRWWCNDFGGRFDINRIKWLKEFIVANPPTFNISPKCCYYAKKLPASRFISENDCDLNCIGVRRSEGGARATAWKTCYTSALSGPDEYRPLFWFTDQDKREYDEHYGLKHSECYEVWGMKRTGCAGCPFGRNFEQEIALAEKYEPNFYKAMIKIFGPSYEYTRQFRKFREQMNQAESNGAEEADGQCKISTWEC